MQCTAEYKDVVPLMVFPLTTTVHTCGDLTLHQVVEELFKQTQFPILILNFLTEKTISILPKCHPIRLGLWFYCLE